MKNKASPLTALLLLLTGMFLFLFAATPAFASPHQPGVSGFDQAPNIVDCTYHHCHVHLACHDGVVKLALSATAQHKRTTPTTHRYHAHWSGSVHRRCWSPGTHPKVTDQIRRVRQLARHRRNSARRAALPEKPTQARKERRLWRIIAQARPNPTPSQPPGSLQPTSYPLLRFS